MLRFLPLVWKTVTRKRTQALLTAGGVALAMFLFTLLHSLGAGVTAATQSTAGDSVLVVYRESRFCPFTSRLPERYVDTIRKVPGVESVLPVRVVVSNCRASLDVVTFRGVPKDEFVAREASRVRVVEGSLADWTARGDAALVGRTLADRRRLRPGDRFDASGVTVTVAAVFESDDAQDRNVAYVDLPFLQRTPGAQLVGAVTQFNVRVSDPSRMDEIARRIDDEFHGEADPTSTRSEKAFTARAAADVLELVRFGEWVAIGCAAAVLALVANAITLSVQDRVRDLAVMETLGYTGRLLAGLVVFESTVLALTGGIVGVGAAAVTLRVWSPSLTSEGLSIGFETDASVAAVSLVVAAAAGVLAGLVPAWRVSRFDLVGSFRAV
jgi:putative ABC transport system permease protein